MEKIKQALARAKLERGAESTGNDVKVHEPKVSVAPPGKLTTSINYSETQVLKIEKEVLIQNRVVLGLENDEPTTAYKILRTQVQHRLSAKNWNAVAITSPSADQGKTLTAVNLSIAIAREVQRTVLLVDLDLRNPSIPKMFGLRPEIGVVDFLLDDIPLSEMLLNPGIERLVILPAGRSVVNSSELISSPKMGDLVRELKARYPSRIIIFDLPPLLVADDMLAFAPYVDSTLLVLEDGKTTKEELVRSVEIIGEERLLGAVLNKAKEIQPTYY